MQDVGGAIRRPHTQPTVIQQREPGNPGLADNGLIVAFEDLARIDLDMSQAVAVLHPSRGLGCGHDMQPVLAMLKNADGLKPFTGGPWAPPKRRQICLRVDDFEIVGHVIVRTDIPTAADQNTASRIVSNTNC